MISLRLTSSESRILQFNHGLVHDRRGPPPRESAACPDLISGAGGWQARAAGSASEGLRIVELVNNIMLELNSYLVSYSLEPPF